MRARFLLGLMLLASPVLSETIDNCATLLGSISVELRIARALPPTTRTTFTCPRDTHSLLGASKQRILNSLGTPDATGATDASPAETTWAYFFMSSAAGAEVIGNPELTFSFNERQLVSDIRCQRTH